MLSDNHQIQTFSSVSPVTQIVICRVQTGPANSQKSMAFHDTDLPYGVDTQRYYI